MIEEKIIWLTGQPGSGKTTLANLLKNYFYVVVETKGLNTYENTCKNCHFILVRFQRLWHIPSLGTGL